MVRGENIGMQVVLTPKLLKGRFKKALIKMFFAEHSLSLSHTQSVKTFLLCVNIVLGVGKEQLGRYL